MFTNIHIERFRGIPSLDIDGLKPINLIVGKNNSGKTSVLEAIFLLCGATDPMNSVKVANQRGQRMTTKDDADSAWRSLFHQMDVNKTIEIGITQSDRYTRRLGIEAPSSLRQRTLFEEFETKDIHKIGGVRFNYRSSGIPRTVITEVMHVWRRFAGSRPTRIDSYTAKPDEADVLPASFLSARSFVSLRRDANRYSNLVKARAEQSVLDALQVVEPKLKRLAVISESSDATIYVDLGGESLIPMAVCGEGMLRLFSIILAITNSHDGVLLVDEIDNGLHHTVMEELWPVLRKLCAEHNVQLFATTHNEEMLRHAIEAFRGDLCNLGLFRLDRNKDGLRAASYNAEALEGVLETGWEVRG